MKKGYASIIFSLIFCFATQCDATESLCKDLPNKIRFKTANCSEFIECRNQKDIIMLCPNGLGFDDRTKSCSWSNEVCPGQITLENDCKKNGQIIADPNSADCNRFQYCTQKEGSTNLELELVYCPVGEIFNPTGYTTYNGTGAKPCSAESKYFCPNSAPRPDCKKIDSGTYIPDPDNCSGYYYCYDGSRMMGKCSRTHHFDIQTKSCVDRTQSQCKEISRISDICKDQSINSRIADSRLCTAYYTCVRGIGPYHVFCPEGQYFDDICTTLRPATCSCEDVKGTHEVNVKHKDINKYWECSEGKRTLKKCFKGSIYDPSLDSCVFGGDGFLPRSI